VRHVSKLENNKDNFGAILSRVKFQSGLARLAILNTWNKNTKKNKSRKPKQCSTPVHADTTYIAVNANAHGKKTRPGMSEF